MINQIKQELKQIVIDHFDIEDVTIELPKRGLADLAIPLFSFAKIWKSSPKAVFEKLEPVFVHDDIDQAVGQLQEKTGQAKHSQFQNE